MRAGFLCCIATLWLWAGVAQAQSAPTCQFDQGAAAVTVSVTGGRARLRAVASTGEIRLNGDACAGATVFNTDTIQVNGGTVDDEVSLSGTFAPGLTPEATGGSEIEISFALGGFNDMIVVNLGGGGDQVVFTSDGIDVGNDGDRDILTAGSARITVNGNGGNDRIDASAYTGSTHGPGVILHGGAGRDVLIGSTVEWNSLYGEEGDDVLYGGNDQDQLRGGMGNDQMFGYGGNDYFLQEATIDGADDMRAGDGIDTIQYIARTSGVTVTVGDALASDGEPGEGDNVDGDFEYVWGGSGPDVLVGNGLQNTLIGRDGNDELYGGDENDILWGEWGNDILVGDSGDDTLWGGPQDDSLDGGLGADILHGESGADFLDGGDAVDQFFGDGGRDTFVNDDAYAETVDCGAGAGDDPQPSALDTFIGCEQI